LLSIVTVEANGLIHNLNMYNANKHIPVHSQ